MKKYKAGYFYKAVFIFFLAFMDKKNKNRE